MYGISTYVIEFVVFVYGINAGRYTIHDVHGAMGMLSSHYATKTGVVWIDRSTNTFHAQGKRPFLVRVCITGKRGPCHATMHLGKAA